MKENSSFMLLTLTFAITFGSYVGFGNCISNILDPYGLQPYQLAQIGIGLLVSGLFGAVVSGIFVDRTGKYKACILIMLTMIVTCISIMAYSLMIDDIDTFVNTTFVLGFCAVGYVPISLALGVELTFPMQPVTVNGSMIMLAQGSGFLLSLLLTVITDDIGAAPGQTAEEHLEERQFHSVCSILVASLSIFLALCLTCCVKEDLRRYAFMNPKDKINDSDF